MPHGRGQYSIQCISFDFNLTALYSSVTSGNSCPRRPLVHTRVASLPCPVDRSRYSLRFHGGLSRIASTSGYVLIKGAAASLAVSGLTSFAGCIVIDGARRRSRTAAHLKFLHSNTFADYSAALRRRAALPGLLKSGWSSYRPFKGHAHHK